MDTELDLSFRRPTFDRGFAQLVWAAVVLFAISFEVIAHQRPTDVTSVGAHMRKLSASWADMIEALGCADASNGAACAASALHVYAKEAEPRTARLLSTRE